MNRIIKYLEQEIKGYKALYKEDLTESEDIETYGTNEFFGGKLEAYEDMLQYINTNKELKE